MFNIQNSLKLAAMALIAFAGGCMSGSPQVTFKSTESSQAYTQKFDRSFFSRTADGQYEVVLLEDGITPQKTNSNGPILSSSSAGPISQAVHVRVLWKPLRGAKPDTPSATNSVIDWYLRGNDAGGEDRLHYRGAGFVSIYDDGDTARFIIRNAHVDPSDGGGRLHDPLGSSTLTGDFVAAHNEGMVSAATEEFRHDTAAARSSQPSQASAHGDSGPPPRAPTGP